MNFTDATKAMRAYFHAEWNDASPVAYDDVPFDKPDGEPWVRFTIKHNEAAQASIGSPGSNRHRRYGMVIAQIFTPEGTGSINARAFADTVMLMFIGKNLDGIHFYNTISREIGPDGSGWYQINVAASFWYDQIA